MISADEKLIKTTRDKRSGGSILQIFKYRDTGCFSKHNFVKLK